MIVSANWIPSRFEAVTIGPFIFIRPLFRDDKALIAHERQHMRDQFRFAVIGYFLLFKFSWQFRLWAELRGHLAQIAAGGISADEAARRIASEYRIPLTEQEILRRLVQV